MRVIGSSSAIPSTRSSISSSRIARRVAAAANRAHSSAFFRNPSGERSSGDMRRSDLEHILRAASAITLRNEFVFIGSQAILAEHPDAPIELVRSIKLDIYPRGAPSEGDLIDGAIGEGSVFHNKFGYYAHGVGPETATLPNGWEERLVPISGPGCGGATAWCLET